MRFICVQAQSSSGQARYFDESRCGGFIVAGQEFRALVKRRLAGDCEERMTLRLRCAAHILTQTPHHIAGHVDAVSKCWCYPNVSAPLLIHLHVIACCI